MSDLDDVVLPVDGDEDGVPTAPRKAAGDLGEETTEGVEEDDLTDDLDDEDDLDDDGSSAE